MVSVALWFLFPAARRRRADHRCTRQRVAKCSDICNDKVRLITIFPFMLTT